MKLSPSETLHLQMQIAELIFVMIGGFLIGLLVGMAVPA